MRAGIQKGNDYLVTYLSCQSTVLLTDLRRGQGVRKTSFSLSSVFSDVTALTLLVELATLLAALRPFLDTHNDEDLFTLSQNGMIIAKE